MGARDVAEHLVVGGDGLIGRKVVSALRAKGESVWSTTRRPETLDDFRYFLDLERLDRDWLPDRRFDTVFLCAGRNPKQCLQDPVGSRVVNVEAPLIVSQKLMKQGSFIVKLSSNAVFDGATPYQSAYENHSPHSLYGQQHSELDKALLNSVDRVAVVRFSKVISPAVPVFDSWIEALGKGRVIHPLSDLRMAPLSLSFIVDLIVCVGLAQRSGVFQASGAHDISYAEAARVAVRALGLSETLVHAATTEELGLDIGWQPRHTTLDMTETEQAFGLSAQTISGALSEITRAPAATVD